MGMTPTTRLKRAGKNQKTTTRVGHMLKKVRKNQSMTPSMDHSSRDTLIPSFGHILRMFCATRWQGCTLFATPVQENIPEGSTHCD